MIYPDDNIHEALEKIAKVPRAVAGGGGGELGMLMRAKRGMGRLASKGNRPEFRRWKRHGQALKEQIDTKTGLKKNEGYWRAFKQEFQQFEPHGYPPGRSSRPNLTWRERLSLDGRPLK